MPTTPLRAYPYPSLASAPDVPADITALATALDTDVGAFSTAWTAYVPTWTATSGVPAVGTGAGSMTGVRTLMGKTCRGRIRIILGTGFSTGTGTWTFTLPVTAAHPSGRHLGGWTFVDTSAADRYVGAVITASSTTIQCVYGNGPITGVGFGIPFTLAAADVLDISFAYETV
jgi:hypothetical protein